MFNYWPSQRSMARRGWRRGFYGQGCGCIPIILLNLILVVLAIMWR